MTRAGPAYAARRALRSSLQPLPLYRIDQLGQAHEVAKLLPLYPAGCAIEFIVPLDWPLDEDIQDGWFDGLPTGVFDQINPAPLHVASRPNDWRAGRSVGRQSS